jgi:hypothetical protein
MDLVSRVDAFFSNIKFPWEKPTQAQVAVTVGAIIAFSVTKEEKGGLKFAQLWGKSYVDQTSVISWSPQLKILAIGMDDGRAHCIRVGTDKKYTTHEDVFKNIIYV